MKKIRTLLKLELINLFGINEFRYNKDRKKKNSYLLMAVMWALLVFSFLHLIYEMCLSFKNLGLAYISLEYIFVMAGITALFFNLFKTGQIIYDLKSYEKLYVYPVTKTEIIVSKFLSMYVRDLAIAVLVMLPGIIVYQSTVSFNLLFYVYLIISIICLPIFPLAIATILGSLISFITSKLEKSNILNIIFTILVFIVMMFASSYISSKLASISDDDLINISTVLTKQIESIYVFAKWFRLAVIDYKVVNLVYFILVSFGAFGVVVFVLQSNYHKICIALNQVRSKRNYDINKLVENKVSTSLMALLKKEVKRYFASSIYVMNTIVGFVLMALIGVVLLFADIDVLSTYIGIGIPSSCIPFLIALCGSLMPTTSNAISLEGDTFWLAKTLPIKEKDYFNSKILLNLVIAAPFYLIAVVANIFAISNGFISVLEIIFVPLIYLVFGAVICLFINIKFPLLKYENEIVPVKKSTSTLLSMLSSLIVTIIPFLLIINFSEYVYFIEIGFLIVLVLICIFVYSRVIKTRLINIE